MPKGASQTINGKAFEYALLSAFLERLSHFTMVHVVNNAPYSTAKKCFDSFNEEEQGKYSIFASSSVNFLIDVEPRLTNSINKDDILTLEIVSDKRGQEGDVRDVLAIRSSQNWEVGISAKNNHKAVKHSRLSHLIDFGQKWLGIPCSSEYFSEISPIFSELQSIRKESNARETWDNIGDYHTSVYVPVLNAFKEELQRLDSQNPGVVAERLVSYLIGNEDFYKVIKSNKHVEIQAYNIHGTLNLPFKDQKAKHKTTRLKLPTRIIEIVFQENSKNTLIVSLNEGWQISFRIHNASSRVEASLKFDINLVSTPKSLFVTHISIP